MRCKTTHSDCGSQMIRGRSKDSVQTPPVPVTCHPAFPVGRSKTTQGQCLAGGHL